MDQESGATQDSRQVIDYICMRLICFGEFCMQFFAFHLFLKRVKEIVSGYGVLVVVFFMQTLGYAFFSSAVGFLFSYHYSFNYYSYNNFFFFCLPFSFNAIFPISFGIQFWGREITAFFGLHNLFGP